MTKVVILLEFVEEKSRSDAERKSRLDFSKGITVFVGGNGIFDTFINLLNFSSISKYI